MTARPVRHLEFESVVARLREFARSRGEATTRNEFAKHLGIHHDTLTRYCGPWQTLRDAAGLQRPCAPRPPTFSDQFLIDEYRRVATQLGRPPRPFEFNQVSPVRYGTLISRFGTAVALHRRARIRDEFVQTFGPDFLSRHKAAVPWDENWLRELWSGIRVAFVLRSSDLHQAFHPDSGIPLPESPPLPDVIFCGLHDWPTAPVPVLVAADVLGERARQPPLSQP